jgi:hypothetical protein
MYALDSRFIEHRRVIHTLSELNKFMGGDSYILPADCLFIFYTHSFLNHLEDIKDD